MREVLARMSDRSDRLKQSAYHRPGKVHFLWSVYCCVPRECPSLRWPEIYNPQNEMFAAFETNRSLLKNETYPKFKKFSPGFAGV